MQRTNKKLSLIGTITVGAGLLGLIYSCLPATPAHAQNTSIGTTIVKSAGPIQLNHNEPALIGLLLPAVQNVYQTYQLQLIDSAGNIIVTIPIAVNGDRRTSANFQVAFGDNSLRILDQNTGKLITEKTRSDGSITAVLLPAVQRTGRSVGAISASVQLFENSHTRGMVINMCDGSV